MPTQGPRRSGPPSSRPSRPAAAGRPQSPPPPPPQDLGFRAGGGGDPATPAGWCDRTPVGTEFARWTPPSGRGSGRTARCLIRGGVGPGGRGRQAVRLRRGGGASRCLSERWSGRGAGDETGRNSPMPDPSGRLVEGCACAGRLAARPAWRARSLQPQRHAAPQASTAEVGR